MIHTAMNEFGKTHPDYTFTYVRMFGNESGLYRIWPPDRNPRRTYFRGIYKPVATILTQVVIDPYDDAFAEPEKIIGRVLTEEVETEESKETLSLNWLTGTYKRILAAPKPQKIVEAWNSPHTCRCGPGSNRSRRRRNPGYGTGIDLHGASAIIEKDLSSGLLAQELNADTLLILTSVGEKVSLNLGQTMKNILIQFL